MRILLKLGRGAATATVLMGSVLTGSLHGQEPAAAQSAQQPGQPAQQESPYKDTAEYELVMSIQKEQDPQKKNQLLQQWQEKYPDSKLKTARLQLMLQTYQQLGNAAQMKKVATEMTVADPQGLIGLVGFQTLNLLTVSMNDTSETALADGEKAANGLLAILDQVKKPEQVAEDVWAKETNNYKALAHKTLGWVALNRKNFPQAEAAYTESIKIKPNQGDIALLLGNVILRQRIPEKQASALYQYARAASLEGEGALAPPQRQQAKAYVEKTYTNFHGSQDGLDEILTRAKTEPFPPDDFKIVSKAEIQQQDREKLKAEDPPLYLWLNVKDNLTGADGDTAAEAMKGSDVGLGQMQLSGFKGKLISATPETNPKEIQLSVQDGLNPDAILRFPVALKGKADSGIELEFKGALAEVSKDPYILTFDVNTDDLKGWPAPPPPAKKRPAARKKK